MAISNNRWVIGAAVFVGALGGANVASAQFNPYVMPRFNPANPVMPPGPSAVIVPDYAPYVPSYPSYYPSGSYYGPSGGTFMGVAEVYRAYGTVLMNTEQARILREQSIQAKLDTKRKRFELDMYLRANTPTFAEEQARAARNSLKRLRNTPTQGEVSSGTALNVMLDDARKLPVRKVDSEKLISEAILGQLNVTSSFVGLGILRNDGRIPWTLAAQEALTVEQRKTFDAQAQALVQGALKGKIDLNVFRDFSDGLDKAYDNLLKRANDMDGQRYLDAKRFLGDLKDARTALEKGEAQNQADYKKFITGGKSIQEVIEFMVSRGLRFAPATVLDEGGYRAFYSAFAQFDVALNPTGGAVDNK